MKAVRWLKFAALGLIGLVVAGLLIGLATEKLLELRDERLYPPPGRMVDSGNGRRHIFCEGSGTPTVVLITGMGIPSVLIRPLEDRASPNFPEFAHMTVPGSAGAEPSVRPLNVVAQAAELQRVIAANGEGGPFIMIGHSYGGLIARQYLKDNPHTVAGMVLVDSGEEGEVFQAKALQSLTTSLGRDEHAELLSRFWVSSVRWWRSIPPLHPIPPI